MSPLLSQRTSMVLLAALGIALAFGLLAAGSHIGVRPMPTLFADERPLLGLPAAANALTSAPLAAIAAFGLIALRRAVSWPMALRRPLAVFFLMAGASGLLAAGYHVAPARISFAAAQVCLSSACASLMLAFLAERVDLRFGSWSACAAALGAALLAGGYWWVSGGDLRLLVWFDVMPALLVPAGMLMLPGLHTHQSDWMLMLGIYIAARLAELGDAVLFELLGIVSGHSLMHLGLAAVCAVMAWRVRVVARAAQTGASRQRAARAETADQLS